MKIDSKIKILGPNFEPFDFKPLIGKRILLHPGAGVDSYEAVILNVSESGSVKLKYEGTDPLSLNSRTVWINIHNTYMFFEIL